MQRQRTTYSLERIASSSALLTSALGIYARNIVPSIRTSTNDIVYWASRYNTTFQDELLLFAFRVDGVVAGYAEMLLFREDRILVVDYLALDEAYRRNNAFFEFAHQIQHYLDANDLAYDEVVAEVPSFTESDAPLHYARSLIRLLKLLGFGVLKSHYYQPALGLSNEESLMRATLLIRRNDPQSHIKRETFLRIVNIIYYKHYLRWYQYLPGVNGNEYKAHIDDLFARVGNEAPKKYVEINGSWEWNEASNLHPVAAQPEFAASKPFVIMILVVFGALCCAHALFKLDAVSVALLAVLAVVVVFSVLSVFSAKAGRVFHKVTELLMRLCGKTE